MRRFVVIVLDGFGIGAMDDARIERQGDEKANTLRSILDDEPDLQLPNLEYLGLMNAYGRESAFMKFSPKANYGKSVNAFWRGYFYGTSGNYGNASTKTRSTPVSGKSG